MSLRWTEAEAYGQTEARGVGRHRFHLHGLGGSRCVATAFFLSGGVGMSPGLAARGERTPETRCSSVRRGSRAYCAGPGVLLTDGVEVVGCANVESVLGEGGSGEDLLVEIIASKHVQPVFDLDDGDDTAHGGGYDFVAGGDG